MLTHERATALRSELRELQSKSSYTVDDLARIDEIGQPIAKYVAPRVAGASDDLLVAASSLQIKRKGRDS